MAIFGGITDNNKYLGDLGFLDLSKKHWSIVKLPQTAPSPRVGHLIWPSVNKAGESIVLVFGGQEEAFKDKTIVYRYNCESKQWSNIWVKPLEEKDEFEKGMVEMERINKSVLRSPVKTRSPARNFSPVKQSLLVNSTLQGSSMKQSLKKERMLKKKQQEKDRLLNEFMEYQDISVPEDTQMNKMSTLLTTMAVANKSQPDISPMETTAKSTYFATSSFKQQSSQNRYNLQPLFRGSSLFGQNQFFSLEKASLPPLASAAIATTGFGKQKAGIKEIFGENGAQNIQAPKKKFAVFFGGCMDARCFNDVYVFDYSKF